MRALLAAFALATVGCGFHASSDPKLDGGDDAFIPTDDGSLADLSGADLTGADLTSVDACPHPQLLVGLEALGGTGHGTVLRFTVGAGGLTACSSLSGAGTLPAQPMAVAFVPPDAVAAATRDGLWLLGADDSVRWMRADSRLPVDVAPVVAPTGQTAVAVGYWKGFTSQPEVDDIDLVPDGTNAVVTAQQPSGVLSFSSSPLDSHHLFVLDTGSSGGAAVDLAPYGGARTVYRALPGSPANLISIAAAVQFGLNRVVWVDAVANSVYYVRENTGAPTLSGPIRCTATCTLVHAVPDPTAPERFLGLCEHAGTTVRDIVRWSSTGGACGVLFDGATPGPNTRLSRLAVAN